MNPATLKRSRSWFDANEIWVWLNAGALALSVCAVAFVLLLIAVKGLTHFWPQPLYEVSYRSSDGSTANLIGELVETDTLSRVQYLEAGGDESRLADDTSQVERWLFKTGNRRLNPPDFRWVYQHDVISQSTPEELASVERVEWGFAFGRLQALRFLNNETPDSTLSSVSGAELRPVLQRTLQRLNDTRAAIRDLENGTIRQISSELQELRFRQRSLQLQQPAPADVETQQAQLSAEERILLQTYAEQEAILSGLLSNLAGSEILLETQTGQQHAIDLADTLRVTYPNRMSVLDKVSQFAANVGRFLTDDPREANTEGGVFPAIFGTVLMVLLMSVVVTPIGVITAIYLHEYATRGPLVRVLRIAVSNLAGVPSIVYGVFGLGFFVYFLGGNIDQLFYQAALPAPTFGTPGLFWASLTLALLTVPVVIVSTEEGLARIPMALREGSLALGATRAETLFQVVLPMASPAILTGVILAVARAAGEVAPLMLVGVVKLAPALPIDGDFPFLHLDRKFMHLGFHIYDVGFQSPNVEAARPLVYATALLLITIIVSLNLVAITLRHRLEQRYRSFE